MYIDNGGCFAVVDDLIVVTGIAIYLLICTAAIYASTPEGQRGFAELYNTISHAYKQLSSRISQIIIDSACGTPSPDNGDDDDDDYYDNDSNCAGREKKNKNKGKTPRSNEAQNRQANDARRGLTKAQKRQVHDKVSGKGLGYHDIVEEAEYVAGKITTSIIVFFMGGKSLEHKKDG